MKGADLTHGGFYSHFRSKEDLVQEVLRAGMDDAGDGLEASIAHLDGRAWIEAWVDGYLSDGHVKRVGQGCPLPSLTAEVARGGMPARRAFRQSLERRMNRVCPKIPAPRPEAEQRLLTAYAQMAGALMMARALGEPASTVLRGAAGAVAKAVLLGEAPLPASVERGGER